jgi:lysophospholipid hydrolase
LAGDTLFRNPEQERSFYIVVDGHVQMFVKPDNDTNNNYSDDDDDDDEYDYNNDDDTTSFGSSDSDDLHSNDDGDDSGNGINNWGRKSGNNKKRRNDKFKDYTLINEVGQGGTLSSLFTILSVFRESFHRGELKDKAKNKSMRHQIASRSSQQHQHLAPTALRHGSTELPVPPPVSVNDTSSDEWRHVFPNLENQTSDPSLPMSSNSSVAATPDMSPKDTSRSANNNNVKSPRKHSRGTRTAYPHGKI